MKRAGVVVARVVGVLALSAFGLLVLGASAWLHLQSPVGRRAFGDAAGALASGQISGTLRVEGVRTVRLPEVEVDRLLVRTAEGIEVLDLRDIAVELDVFASAYHGGLVLRSARVGGGEVAVVMSPNGEPWIERAFAGGAGDGSASGDGGRSGSPWWAPPGRWTVRLEGVRYEDLRARVELDGSEMLLADAKGRARIWLPDQSDAQLRFWGVNGRLRTSHDLIPDADVHGLALTIDPTSQSTVRFASGIDALDAPLTVAGHVPARSGEGARICVWTDGVRLASLYGIGGEVGTSLFTSVSLDVRHSEAPDPPRCPDEREEPR